MNKGIQYFGLACGVVYAVLVGLGIFVIPGWIPVPPPTLTPEETGAMYNENVQMRVGMMIALFASGAYPFLPAVLAVHMRRIEGKNHVLANTQLACQIMAAVVVMMSTIFVLAVSFRTEQSLSEIMTMNDYFWFMIISNAPPLIWMNIALGVCILAHKDQNVFPRWLGFFNLWVAVLSVPALGSLFLFEGPLAWDGLLSFWVPVPLYFFWWVVMFYAIGKAIAQEGKDAPISSAALA